PFPPQLFSPLAARMVAAIVAQVQAEVPAYAVRGDGDPCPHLEVATRAAVRVFLDGNPTRESERRKLDELFRRLGHREAQRGHEPGPMVSALRIASRCAWDQVADFAVAEQYSVTTLRDISASLMAFADHLRGQLLSGYELGSRFTTHNRATSRVRLFDFII